MPPLTIVYLLPLIRRGDSLSQVLGEGQPQLKGVKVIDDYFQGSFVFSYFYFLIKEIKATNFPLSISLPTTHRCWRYVLTVFHFWIARNFIFQISFIIQESEEFTLSFDAVFSSLVMDFLFYLLMSRECSLYDFAFFLFPCFLFNFKHDFHTASTGIL